MSDAVNLHSHTYLSDGVLGPAELLRRVEVLGVVGLAITDHVDASNIDTTLWANRQAVEQERKYGTMLCMCGIELTHVRPKAIGEMIRHAHGEGAEFVVVHGETTAEPVEEGTNRAAIEGGCNMLAHPGHLTLDDAKLAAERGVLIEISGRQGHNITNEHVVKTCREAGAKMVFGGDWHIPDDLLGKNEICDVLQTAGLTEAEITSALNEARACFSRFENS